MTISATGFFRYLSEMDFNLLLRTELDDPSSTDGFIFSSDGEIFVVDDDVDLLMKRWGLQHDGLERNGWPAIATGWLSEGLRRLRRLLPSIVAEDPSPMPSIMLSKLAVLL